MAGQFILNIVTPRHASQSGSIHATQVTASANRNAATQLSHEEQIIVKALSLDDNAAVHVNTSRTLSDNGLSIYIRGDIRKTQIDFNLSGTRREFTKWTEIVDGLVYKELLESKHFGSGMCYSLSHNGYITSDVIDESVLDNIPSILDDDVHALSDYEKVLLKATSLSSDGKVICFTDIISDCGKFETNDGSFQFANGMVAEQSALWDEVVNRLVTADLLNSLMGRKGQRYYKLTHKGYSIASRINQDVLDEFKKKE